MKVPLNAPDLGPAEEAAVLDALRYGLRASVLRAGCRAVNVQPEDERQAYREMEQAGAILLP